jgi:ParB/RepB/Spo0J family partition protein
MSRVYALANQKGGVGKTTTAINLGAALGALERRVLVVDCDPQGNATRGLGRSREPPHLYHVLSGEAEAAEADPPERLPAPRPPPRQPRPGRRRGRVRRPRRLGGAAPVGARAGHRPLRHHPPRLPPSLGHLTVLALVAADGVLVPLQCEYFALEGVSELLATVRGSQGHSNPAGDRRHPADDVRRPHEPDPRRRNRDPAPLRPQGLSHRGATQRPPGRGAQPRAADSPVRHQVPWRRGVSGARPRAAAEGGVSDKRARVGARPGERPAPSEPAAPTRTLPVTQLTPNRFQPRSRFDEPGSRSSRSRSGPGRDPAAGSNPGGPGGAYTIVAGERRWRAAQRAGSAGAGRGAPVATTAALELALVENLQREPTSTRSRRRRPTRRSQDEFGSPRRRSPAGRQGSRSTITNALRLLRLPAGGAAGDRTARRADLLRVAPKPGGDKARAP